MDYRKINNHYNAYLILCIKYTFDVLAGIQQLFTLEFHVALGKSLYIRMQSKNYVQYSTGTPSIQSDVCYIDEPRCYL
jgi:hypothetical protein